MIFPGWTVARAIPDETLIGLAKEKIPDLWWCGSFKNREFL